MVAMATSDGYAGGGDDEHGSDHGDPRQHGARDRQLADMVELLAEGGLVVVRGGSGAGWGGAVLVVGGVERVGGVRGQETVRERAASALADEGAGGQTAAGVLGYGRPGGGRGRGDGECEREDGEDEGQAGEDHPDQVHLGGVVPKEAFRVAGRHSTRNDLRREDGQQMGINMNVPASGENDSTLIFKASTVYYT